MTDSISDQVLAAVPTDRWAGLGLVVRTSHVPYGDVLQALYDGVTARRLEIRNAPRNPNDMEYRRVMA